jgi:hypothetical protein
MKIKRKFISNKKTNRTHEGQMVVGGDGNISRCSLWQYAISRQNMVCPNGKCSMRVTLEIDTLDLIKTNTKNLP